MPEILDSSFVPPRVVTVEPEILTGRRAFAAAQDIFSGSPTAPALELAVGWYDSTVQGERGSFAVVNRSAGLDDLIGEIVRVDYATRHVFAYVLQGATLPTDVQLGLTRRTYMAIARLSVELVSAQVSVVG